MTLNFIKYFILENYYTNIIHIRTLTKTFYFSETKKEI